MKIDLKNLTVKKASEMLAKREITAVELTKAHLDHIAKTDKDIHAYLEVFADALKSAEQADKKIAEGKATTFTGIPFGIKDNILIKGKVASSASKMLEKYHATYDATVIAKLKVEGAVFLGRTNMDEFAMGGSTEKSAYGVTHNPHDINRVAGGTSGGSAAAVASDMALIALGSDTGGSIRQPASFCGVVGLKPTYGAVSRYGLMAAVSSFDQIGPIAKTVTDAELLFNLISGKDPKDGTTLDNVKKSAGLSAQSAGAKKLASSAQSASVKGASNKTKKPVVGIPRSFLKMGGIDAGVTSAFDAAEKKFKELGYEIKDIELPSNKYALPVYYILNFAEVSSNMARYDGVKYGIHVNGKDGIDDYFETRRAGLGQEVIRRILLGAYVLSSGYYDAYYNRANAVRRTITEDFLKAFESVDIIATPVAPSPAFKIGEKNADPVAMYLEDIFTVTANLTGLPALSLPCGKTKKDGKDLPVGLQLTARHCDEQTLFAVGKDFLGE